MTESADTKPSQKQSPSAPASEVPAASSGAGAAIIIDAIIIAAVIIIMYLLRFKSGLIGFGEGKDNYRLLEYLVFLPVGVIIWSLAIFIVRGYEAGAGGATVALTRLATGTVLALALVFVGDAMARGTMPNEWWGVSRKFMLMTFAAGLAALAAARLITGKK